MKTTHFGTLRIFETLCRAAPHAFWSRCLVALVLVTLLCSCAAPQRLNPDDPHASLVYLHVDLSEAPTDIRWFRLQQRTASDPDDIWYYQLHVDDDGIMSHIAVNPGSYTIHNFGGIKTGILGSQSQWFYEFRGDRNGQPPFVIDRSSVYFLGSYKLTVQNHGLLADPTFDLQPVATPSEREVLQDLLVRLEGSASTRPFTRQLALARARLMELSRTPTVAKPAMNTFTP